MKPKNMLVYAATEAEVLDPSIAQASMREIHSAGFDSIYLEFRNVKAARCGARFTHALRELVKTAKSEGLYVAVEASFNNLDASLLEDAPEAFTDALHLHQVVPVGDVITLTLTGDVSTWSFPYAAEAFSEEEKLRIVKRIQLGQPRIQIEGGGCAMTRHPGRTSAVFRWELSGLKPGSTVLIVTRKHHEYSFKDLAHPEVLSRLPAVLESRINAGADELFFDEPHFGFAFYGNDGRAISDRLFESFGETFAYRLEDVLPELWLDIHGSNSPLVRLHYSELLERSLEAMEKQILQTQARCSIHGEAPPLGGHRTMHEELSDDVLIGCSDYFRHDFATTASYTDSVFERPDSMVAMAHLARSMAARRPGREAWNMSWGFRPRPEDQRRYARLLGAMNVRWCLHAWNDTMMFGPGFPHHPCWDSMQEDLAVHRRYLEELDGWAPFSNTLLLYNWRAAATVRGAQRHVQRRGMTLMAWTLTRRSVPFQFVDEYELVSRLKSSQVETVILHWPDALAQSTWQALFKWVKSGGHLTVIGPVPRIFSDGSPVNEEVCSLCGYVPDHEVFDLVLGTKITWDGSEFVFDPKSIIWNVDDAPESTWLDAIKTSILDPFDSMPLATVGDKVVAIQCRRGRGTVTTASFEASFAGTLLEKMLSLAGGPTTEVIFKYQRGSESKTIVLPWLETDSAVEAVS